MSTDYFRLDSQAPAKEIDGLDWRKQLFLFLAAAIIVVSRRPDALTNPQFFAEDGAVWYADAYRLGLQHSLLLPDAGYMQTFPRLVAALVTFAPLLLAPLLMNLIGITVQVLPVNILASARSAVWGSLPFRLLLSFTYLALPNSRELDVVVTNAQWHLALIACLLVLASPPRSWSARLFDAAMLALCGLTGPFCVFLLPVLGGVWWIRRNNWYFVAGALTAVCAAIQTVVVLHADPAIRFRAPLGASPRLFVDILSGHVFLAAILGSADYTARFSFLVLLAIALVGSAPLIYVLVKARWEIKLFILFCLLVFAASLKSPLVSRTEPQWLVLNGAYGIRYWFFPMLAFVWSLLWCARPGQPRWARFSALATLVLMFAGVSKDWAYPRFPDRQFKQYVERFEALPNGQELLFPLYPDGWTMRLVKGTDACRVLPNGFIDQPQNGIVVSGAADTRGWVNAAEPVEDIRLYLDGALVQVTIPNASRTDVDKLYPASPVKNKGWAATIDLTKVKPGRHQLDVRARLSGGCVASIGVRSFDFRPN